MKKLILIISIAVAPVLSAHAASATQLSSLADIESALNQGATVSVAVDLSRCTPAGDTKTPSTTRGGLKVGSYRIVSDGTLSFADDHSTVGTNGEPLWQFIRYQVRTDQTISFTTDLFSLPSYARLAPRIAYACAINQGIEFFEERR